MFEKFYYIIQVFLFLVILLSINPENVYCLNETTEDQYVQNVFAVLSKPFDLSCLNGSNDNISMVMWKIKNNNIPSYINKSSQDNNDWFGSGNGAIRKNKITYDDSTIMVCEVYDSKLLYKRNFKLIVRGPPNNPTEFKGSNNNPKELTLSWKINVTNSKIVKKFIITLCEKLITKDCQNATILYPNLQYTFKNLKSYNDYTASIIAVNEYGRSKRVDTAIRTLPGEPIAKAFISKGESSKDSVNLTISCETCFNVSEMKGEFDHIQIRYKNRNNEDVIIRRDDKESIIYVNIPQLHPYKQYEFYSSVSNGKYYSKEDKYSLTTKQEVPKPPRFLTAGQLTSSTIEVKWLSASDTFGPITGYYLKVYKNEIPEKPIFKTEINADQNRYIIRNLQPNTVYKLLLASINNAGRGDFESTLGRTDRPEPIAPKLLAVQKIDEWIVIQWLDKNLADNTTITIDVCWQKKNDNRNICFTSKKTIGDSKLKIRDYMCNRTSSLCSISVSISEFDLNETYLFYVRAIVPSNTCDTGNCRKLESSSERFELGLHDPNSSAFERLLRRHKYLTLGIGITAVFTLIVILILILICKTKYRHICSNSGTILYPHANGEYIEIYNRQSAPNIISLDKTPYPPIPVANLIEHIFRNKADDGAGFQAEFEAIENADFSRFSTFVAKSKENATKNRYTNVFPYDHSRVQLQCPANGKSDYINASYVDGYHRSNAYIATQGPLKETVPDFWQMVWEQNTEIIVMISNFIERGRCKCEEYWSRKETVYGNISVRLVYENAMAFYTERRFRIRNIKYKKSSNKDRVVYHYQYTDWRDFDVPPSSLPVLVFIRASIRHWSDSSGPIVIHCSAGVGRTGTYICIDSQIRQMEAEHQVNVRGFLEHIRQQRMRLVQTESQYTFIHDALYEYFLCPDHDVHKDDFSTFINRLKEVEMVGGLRKLDIQFKMCVQFEPNEYETLESNTKINIPKNRSDIVPISSRRVNLSCEPGIEGSNYINASIVQGYWEMKEYIITQHPLEQTEQDFWKMVWDENCSMIILLSDYDDVEQHNDGGMIITTTNSDSITDSTTETVNGGVGIMNNSTEKKLPKFWPESEADSRSFRGGMKVGYRTHNTETGCTSYDFLLSSSVEDYAQNVTMHWLKKWPDLIDKSNNVRSGDVIEEYSQLIRLLMLIQSYVASSNPANGGLNNVMMSSSGSGIFSGPLGNSGTGDKSPTSPTGFGLSNNTNMNNDASSGLIHSDQMASGVGNPVLMPGLSLVGMPANIAMNGGAGGGNYSRRRGPVVVIDEYGGSRAAIFVAISHLLSQLRQDDSLDVYFVVKMLHFERPCIFRDPSDLESIYNLLQYIIEHPNSYNHMPPRRDQNNIMNGGMNISQYHNHHTSHHHHNNPHQHHNNNNCIPITIPSNTTNSTSLAGHYATLGDRTNPNTTLSTHRSSRLSSLSSSLSRRHRASSAESQLFLPNQQQPQLQQPTNQINNSSHGNPVAMANYYSNRYYMAAGNRTSWNMGESRPGALPFSIPPPNNQQQLKQQQSVISSSSTQPQIQVISNPLNNLMTSSINSTNNGEETTPLMIASTTTTSSINDASNNLLLDNSNNSTSVLPLSSISTNLDETMETITPPPVPQSSVQPTNNNNDDNSSCLLPDFTESII